MVSASLLLLAALPFSVLGHSVGDHILEARAAASSATKVAGTVTKAAASGTHSSGAVKATTYADGNTFLTSSLPSVFPAGATAFPKAPGLPDLTKVDFSRYPPLDKLPPLDSDEVKAWVKAIDWTKVPNAPVTGLNGCSNTTFNQAALANAEASGNCWWTCSDGHCTRETDISSCPQQEHFGLSFDDGPSPSTPALLTFLQKVNLKATFFVVGSRVVSRPQMLQSTHMMGHQISAHTWAHPSLTTLSNEAIVAELGWSRKAIQDTIGLTVNTFRPPYGDIDDRVRAIASQMGLTPLLWTVDPKTLLSYDTFDWQIGEPGVTKETVYKGFQTIINSAATLDTGFILLEHDLYQDAVEIAIDQLLPEAINFTPKLMIEPIITCQGFGMAQAYVETFDQSAVAFSSSGGSSAGTTTGTVTKSGGKSTTASSAVAGGAATTGGSSSLAGTTAGAAAAATSSPASGADRTSVAGALLLGIAGLGAIMV